MHLYISRLLCPFFYLMVLFCSAAYSETVILKLPKYSDNSHEYYYELIEKSFNLIEESVTIIPSRYNLPQKRAVVMLKRDKLDAVWLIRSNEREQLFTSAAVGLTNGLIGKRVFFIPKGNQYKYDKVMNLDDFRALKLTGAFGKNWFDIKVWEENGLQTKSIDGEWRSIYKLVEKKVRNVDYFSRGINEIVNESKLHPNLSIEKRLVFTYDRDFQLYLGKSTGKHQKLFHKALTAAKQGGLINSLIQKYWAEVYTKIDLNNRLEIKLKLPDS